MLLAGSFSVSALAQTELTDPPHGEPAGLTMDQFQEFDQSGQGSITREDTEQAAPMLSEQFGDIDKAAMAKSHRPSRRLPG